MLVIHSFLISTFDMPFSTRPFVVVLISCLAFIGIGTEAMAQHSRTVRDSVRLSQDGKLKLVTTSGTVDVRGWDRSFVALEATIKGSEAGAVDATKILIDGDSSSVTVRADNAEADGLGLIDFLGFGGSDDLLTDYRIRMPAEASLRVSAKQGSVRVSGIDGDVTVEAGSASSRIRDVGGELIVGTFSGSLDAANVGGEVIFGSFSGSVTLGASPLPSKCTVGTFSGNADIVLPATAAFNLQTDISWGGVSSDFPIPDSASTEDGPVSIGGGGPQIVFESVTGHLTLRSR